ncbi:polyphosphate--glucose phosphotransferase [Cellulophaga omnivescoria]|uniref:polyphosphate--glucose phosphotransferase n=1 Tax=Cellulophaga omnivescoria TaxID=1888890 RepID=UPI000987D3AF|nr:ROK family protein [Cellulophaga omnivescoria]WBU88452.1 ROK family protein [Cellulophaga omnivescoria]
MEVLGIDIGGSGIKGAIVNVTTGEKLTERFRIPTPPTKKPKEMAKVIKKIIKHFNYNGPVGCGFPTLIKNGICKTPGNLHKKWVGVDVTQLFSETTGLPFTVINDADAACYAEMNYGAGKELKGFVIMITIGTGLGSSAYLDGKLIPNFELGQIPYKKHKKIELWAADSARQREELSFKKWGKRVNTFLEYVELLVAPDAIVIGGGISKEFDKFSKHIKINTPVIPAVLENHAGIIGAASATLNK